LRAFISCVMVSPTKRAMLEGSKGVGKSLIAGSENRRNHIMDRSACSLFLCNGMESSKVRSLTRSWVCGHEFVARRSWHFHKSGFPVTSLLPPHIRVQIWCIGALRDPNKGETGGTFPYLLRQICEDGSRPVFPCSVLKSFVRNPNPLQSVLGFPVWPGFSHERRPKPTMSVRKISWLSVEGCCRPNSLSGQTKGQGFRWVSGRRGSNS
jgi:hypothetical protein